MNNNTEYELINPSDPYTFLAEDYETAVLTVFAISTAYAAKSKDGSLEVPLFILGGAEAAKKWYIEEFGRTPEAGMEAKKATLAAALSSMMYGHFEDRRRYNAALEAITDSEKKEKFIAEWQDGRSSINDIGTCAHKLADRLCSKDK